jgi:hypothetical protein
MAMSEWKEKTINAYTMKDVEIEIQKLRDAGWFVGGYQYTNSKNIARIEYRKPSEVIEHDQDH